MSKKTLVCIHIMPTEIEMFQRFMVRYKKAMAYLDENDDVTILATLNLNPKLTDWEKSEISQQYFIDIFEESLKDVPSIQQLIVDESLWGTTQQKREAINLPFDQFIFVDTDIAINEQLLKYQLNASYYMEGMYILSPSIPRWWDVSWDSLVDSKFINGPLGTAFEKEVFDESFNHQPQQVKILNVNPIKFGCGMHTLYSKEFWQFVGIPESFGGYGPEDTYALHAANHANTRGYDIKQYRLDDIYIVEDYSDRTPSFIDKLHIIGNKKEQKDKADSLLFAEVDIFARKI